MTAFGMGYQVAPKEPYYGSTLTEASPDGPWDRYVGRLLTFIPGDVVAGYTAVFVLIPADSFWAQWTLVAACLLFASVLVLLGYIPTARKMKPFSLASLPWFRIIAAPLAFATWVIALPRSPFDAIYSASWFKTAILIFGAAALAACAPVFEHSLDDG